MTASSGASARKIKNLPYFVRDVSLGLLTPHTPQPVGWCPPSSRHDIPLETVQAFEAAAIARKAEDLKEFFEERAGVLEFDAGLPRPEAEIEAARKGRTVVRQSDFTGAPEVKP